MSAKVDPSPYAPPAVASALPREPRARRASEGELRLLPGWVWLFPAAGVACVPSFLALDVIFSDFLLRSGPPRLTELTPSFLAASVTLVLLFGSINSFRRAKFAWSRGERYSGWWFASIGTASGLACVYMGNVAAILLWAFVWQL